MTLDQIINVGAKGDDSHSPTSSALVSARAQALFSDLTKREREVLYLLAQGLTNSQIAQRLVVSTSTVDTHIRSIYNKVGVSSRVQATRYAIEHKLLV